MNTFAHNAVRPQSQPTTLTIGALTLWLVASAIAVFFSLVLSDSTIIGDTYLPRTNDSFYHARRILDAAVGERGFYQFDERLHVPEGAWISWPWGYDFLMAKLTQIAQWLVPSLDPMAFISYVPVAWIPVNAALFVAAASASGLSAAMRVLAMFCFAFSPLTQLLHAIGMIDHHYIEHTFVLLNAWLGLRWFRQPDDRRNALLLAIALGSATAFHNGLFILQLFPLLAAFILWLRGRAPAAAASWTFGIGLVVTTLVLLLPSEPFRNGAFEFGLHSWFHLYVAGCTAVAMAFMGWKPISARTVASLMLLSLVLALPMGAQFLSGAGFLSGSFSILDQISEVRSPYRMFTDTLGPTETASYYSWLIVLAPVVLAFYAYTLLRERRPERVFFAVVVTLGLALLLSQMRLHPYGYFALIAGSLLAVDELRARLSWHRGTTFVATFAVVVLAFQPALRERLFLYHAPSADPEYASAFPLMLVLDDLCARDPGTVLASSDDGSAVLFHSECGVIANNFILRQEDKAHIDEVDRLMRLTPAQIRAERPDIKYLLLRTRDFSVIRDGAAYLVADNPIAKQLFIDSAPPHGYELVETVRRRIRPDGPAGIYARLYKVTE